ncbi:MAG: 50S ribosomal protein L9 [Thermodesulfobacteriota bacterium]|nr:50S ribosomal protein L9 [Thermodesulfobacteriota bacterium]
MELILKKTIDTLGEEGDIVKVKAGYGRNYLIPQQKAVLVTKAALAALELEKEGIDIRKERQKQESESISKKISNLIVTIEKRVGEKDKLYGSVTKTDIAEKLAELGSDVDKNKIQLENPIKALGETIVGVKVGYQMTTDIKVRIIPEGGEAEAKAEATETETAESETE